MDRDAKTSLLARVGLFGGLGRPDLAAVADAARERRLAPGERLFEQGDEATHGYVMGWGRLRLDQVTPDGANVVLRFMGPGDMVGTVAVLRRMPYPATAAAVDDCMVLSWTAGQLGALMTAHPRIAINAIGVVGGRIEELQARLAEVATQRVERRIAAALLRLARQSGRKVEDGVEIPFPMTRQDLAEMTATTLHTVSRTFSAWEAEGVIAARRSSHVVIRRPHRLVEIAEQA